MAWGLGQGRCADFGERVTDLFQDLFTPREEGIALVGHVPGPPRRVWAQIIENNQGQSTIVPVGGSCGG